MYHSRLAAGLIVLANRIDDPGIEEARRSQIPMVLIPGDPLKRDVPSVDGNNYDGIRQATEHLIQLGHREIAFLRGPMNSKYTIERLAAFRRALKRHSLPFREDWLIEYDFTPEGAYAGMKKLISLGKPPTGLLLMNDFSAVGVVRAAKELGYRVPQDVSIIGFGDIPLAAMTDPSLTTVREPFQEMGNQAADMLLKMIQGKRIGAKHIILPVELIIRKSTGAPPHDHEGYRQIQTGRWHPSNGCTDSPLPSG
jgi:LacI family transcriptional regulator